ncbi:hypothetical protein [Phytobacter ursingii]|jgi:hypothetical protein|uniref:Uncharacterized protein n=1 Tax=Phytobacter ursingii TaxID=1972431 RepID=A0AB35RUX0_9ENTR|nr:hypothetical protein [Phytobacter ursingii]MDV2865938.1 hypothetical protein [Phytobacter ursingii]
MATDATTVNRSLPVTRVTESREMQVDPPAGFYSAAAMEKEIHTALPFVLYYAEITGFLKPCSCFRKAQPAAVQGYTNRNKTGQTLAGRML